MWVSFIICVSIIFQLTYTGEAGVVSQPDPVMSVSVGDNVTLHCFILKNTNDPIVWYKQTSRQQLYIIAMTQKYMNIPDFYNEFKFQKRFSVEKATGQCHLKITNVTASDEGMYYCGWKKFEIDFAEGTYLKLKGLQNTQHKLKVSVLQRPASVSVHPGDTVMLMCSVLSERTSEDKRMFWFRSDSGKSVPQIIYTYNQSDQCEIDSATQNCTNNLYKDIVSQTDAGMYYCALITCGKILFGNGTKIHVEKPVESIVIILGVLLGVCVLVITAQAVSYHKKERYYNNRENVQDTDKHHPSSQDCDALHYAAPHFKEGKNRRMRRKEAPQDSVYSQLNYLRVTDHTIFE
ncbi:signal-regulatory protein beta-2-like [Triplophysa rosa]|uniref:signal-regulatory protein beta-2-like n=1 Tax=Triplophysa rosa TaxID=992332 RepID=UPI002545D148|nr:signal-regulatory protein beta-2-like [Triplophysa rosa]